MQMGRLTMMARQVAIIGIGGWLMPLTVALMAGCDQHNSAGKQDEPSKARGETPMTKEASTVPTSNPSELEYGRVPLGEIEVLEATPEGEWLEIGGDTPLLWCYRGGKHLVFEQAGPKVYLSIDRKPFSLAGIIVRSDEEMQLVDILPSKDADELTLWVYSPHLKHLTDVKAVDSIDSIHVWERGRGLLTDLTPLAAAKELTSLSIRDCRMVSDLSALQKMGRLSSLDLYDTATAEIKPVTALPIVWLDVRRTDLRPDSIGSLGQLSRLRCLKVAAYETKTSVPLEKALPQLIHLERLTVRYGRVFTEHGDRLISFGKLPSLRSLAIEDMLGSLDLSSLSTLAGLRELHLLGGLDATVDLRPVGRLQKLRALRIEIRDYPFARALSGHRPPGTTDLTPILDLKTLERLEIASEPPTRGHDRIGELPNLRQLILRTPSLTKTPEFKNPEKAISVDFSKRFWSDTSLEDISSLGRLVNLEELRLQGCPQVDDYAVLSKLTKLRYLDISRPGARTLAPLAALTNLEVLVLHNSAIPNLSPLQPLKKLTVLDLDMLYDELDLKQANSECPERGGRRHFLGAKSAPQPRAA